jgi:uncharacterized damage-inducible protein DinB
MAISDPLEILLNHDKWATQQILLACEKLSSEQLSRSFEMGPGSLLATTTHIVGAIRRWNDTLADRSLRPRIEEDGLQYSPAQLLPMLEEAAADLKVQARRLPLGDVVKRSRDGKEYTFTRGAILTHVTTHGMHHRAQCLNMLRRLGVAPLPLSSVLEWSLIPEERD